MEDDYYLIIARCLAVGRLGQVFELLAGDVSIAEEKDDDGSCEDGGHQEAQSQREEHLLILRAPEEDAGHARL